MRFAIRFTLQGLAMCLNTEGEVIIEDVRELRKDDGSTELEIKAATPNTSPDEEPILVKGLPVHVTPHGLAKPCWTSLEIMFSFFKNGLEVVDWERTSRVPGRVVPQKSSDEEKIVHLEQNPPRPVVRNGVRKSKPQRLSIEDFRRAEENPRGAEENSEDFRGVKKDTHVDSVDSPDEEDNAVSQDTGEKAKDD